MDKHAQEMKQQSGMKLQSKLEKIMERIEDTNAQTFKKGDHFSYQEQDYSWLLIKLAATFDSVYMGCPVQIPETVLFSGGKPIKVFRTSAEDGTINQVKNGMSHLEVRKYLMALSLERSRFY